MPSMFTHPIPAIALAVGLGTNIISVRLAVAAVACSILPDLDVLGFALGVHGGLAGHRGGSHSLLVALIIGLCGFITAPALKSGRLTAFCVLLLATASHSVLDALTTGGSGVAFFWPYDGTRSFLPWRPILVSPIRPRAFFTDRGIAVILSELRWVWTPCLIAATAGFAFRALFRKRPYNHRT